ncbi:4Fe-4S dicluster domain-containing protein [Sandaracinus amylolyticus]|uniref:4Fe-4S dicluster domain-containing protein n=1 Tax=Sandaracinus amylolyticus TaxID=927083 RepID=UPI001F28DC14|nr:4Fe-4S dicluster domain-containing protein [Sandaracinus amylolyticus]UJR80932.1 Molybdopterin oxidoreductase, iron-sulfur binding subunit [Sandaracinus amylolyticus]
MSKRPAITHSNALPKGAPLAWRSIEERLDPKRFEELAASEPGVQVDKSDLITIGKKSADSSESKDGVNRRQFLTLSGAAAAAAAMSGCARRPVEHILPYTRQPEYVSPGVPLHYATVLPRRSDVIGVIVESHEGRPTKIEGNALHSGSHPGADDAGGPQHGGTDLQTQAQILNLYDMDRGAHVMRGAGDERAVSSWGDFDEFFGEHLRGLEASAGEGLRFLMEPTTSPTLVAAKQALARRFPQARFHSYSPVSDWNALEGARIAYGRPLHTVPDYSRARVIVSLDSDFLLTESGNPRFQHLFADGRRFMNAEGAREMNRLYVVESGVSVTGANADHRIRMPSQDVGVFARALARALGAAGVDVSTVQGGLGEPAALEGVNVEAIARDLARNRGRSAIVVGARQPAWVHALAHALNAALDNLGQTIALHEVLDAEQQDPIADLRALVADMGANRVSTLVMLGGNPVYDAPHDVAFGDALAGVANKIHLSSHDNETSILCDWYLPQTHELESWGDHRALDGAYAIQQPLIAPLRGGRNAIEVVGFASGERSWRAYHAVRRTFAQVAPGDAFDRAWRAALQRGVVAGSPTTLARDAAPNGATVSQAVQQGAGQRAELGESSWEVSFVPDNKLLDGRWANNAWLLELPDPISKVSWDNAALVSWGSARQLGVRNGDVVRIERDGVEAIEIPVVIVPGTADRAVVLSLGWGRTRGGTFANDHGVDVTPARHTETFWFGAGYRVSRAGRRAPLSLQQEHHSMEGRPLAIDATVEEYIAQPDFGQWGIPTPTTPPLWDEVDYTQPQPPAQGGTSWSLLPEGRQAAEDAPPRHAWGMTIDLTTCTGCNACVIACIAENNIPMVGKEQVARGREMHWLRIDRYFTEREIPTWAGRDTVYDVVDEDHLEVAFQPMACQHCEEAPCENVCPVNATVHSPEGINEMAYNRCIGTRYCANNCPYKVRRFNYLAYAGDVPELQRMQFNPNVSVRMRGVMEKCTYCIQRIESVRIHAHNEGRRIRRGELITACAQACPSNAIFFGDLNDSDAEVTRWAHVDRQYKVLADVGTQPRTTYAGRIRNPNPEMV